MFRRIIDFVMSKVGYSRASLSAAAMQGQSSNTTGNPSIHQHQINSDQMGNMAKTQPPTPTANPKSLQAGMEKEADTGQKAGLRTVKRRDRITIIGPPGSGKSWMYANLIELVNDDKHELIDDINQLEAPQHYEPKDVLPGGIENSHHFYDEVLSVKKGNEKPFAVLYGKYWKDGELVSFELIDTKGGMIKKNTPAETDPFQSWPQIFQVTSRSDLLILVLPPEHFEKMSDRNEVREERKIRRIFTAHVTRMMQENPDGMVAIVYSKCDEYGIRLQGPRRVIFDETTKKSLVKLRIAGDGKEGWKQFMNEIEMHQNHMAGNAASQIRLSLIQATRDIWIQVLRGSKYVAINGYFVTANPGEKHQNMDAAQKGFAQIFIDFIEHQKNIKSIPRYKKRYMIVLFISSLLFLLLVILFKYVFG